MTKVFISIANGSPPNGSLYAYNMTLGWDPIPNTQDPLLTLDEIMLGSHLQITVHPEEVMVVMMVGKLATGMIYTTYSM